MRVCSGLAPVYKNKASPTSARIPTRVSKRLRVVSAFNTAAIAIRSKAASTPKPPPEKPPPSRTAPGSPMASQHRRG
jgi:hypothetical protein